jgi:hypothetical protein
MAIAMSKAMARKPCSRCCRRLPVSEFYRHPGSKDGLYSHKQCHLSRKKELYRAAREVLVEGEVLEGAAWERRLRAQLPIARVRAPKSKPVARANRPVRRFGGWDLLTLLRPVECWAST